MTLANAYFQGSKKFNELRTIAGIENSKLEWIHANKRAITHHNDQYGQYMTVDLEQQKKNEEIYKAATDAQEEWESRFIAEYILDHVGYRALMDSEWSKYYNPSWRPCAGADGVCSMWCERNTGYGC